MFSLVHAVETYPSVTYVHGLVRAVESLARDAPSWLGILLLRLLNTDDDAILLEKELRATRVEDVLTAISQVKRMFPDITVELDALLDRVAASRQD